MTDAHDDRPDDRPTDTPDDREPDDIGRRETARRDDAPPERVGVRHGMFGVRGSGDTSGFGGLERDVVMPSGSPPPHGEDDDEVLAALTDALAARGVTTFDEAIDRVVIHRGRLALHVHREHLQEVALTLRDEPALRYEMCLGASGVHYPDAEERELHVVYPLQSITHNRRLLLETSAPDADPHVPTLTRVYPTTDWHERETYDFFGVLFEGHPSLTRIQMPDDWEGHPQRKDYPLGGIPVEYKGATIPPPDQRRAYN